MAGSARAVDDSFLDEAPDDSFLDDSFLDEAPPPRAPVEGAKVGLGERAKFLIKLMSNPVEARQMVAENPELGKWEDETWEGLGLGGVRGATLGAAGHIGAAAGAVGDMLTEDNRRTAPSWDELKKRYGENKQRVDQVYDDAEAKAPIASALGRTAGTLPAAMAIAPVTGLVGGHLGSGFGGQLARVAATGLDNAVMGGVEGFNESRQGNVEGKLYDAAAGATIAAPMGMAGAVLPQVIKGMYEGGKIAAGKIAQAPGKAQRVVAEAAGGTRPAQEYFGKAPNLASQWGDTAEEDALKALVRRGDMGEEGAKAFEAGAAKLTRSALAKPVSQMAGEESEQVVEAVAEALSSKGLPKDKAAATALMKSALEDAPNATGDDVIRLVIRHDPANVARRVMTSFEAYDPILKKMGIEADPRWAEVYKGSAGLRGDMEAGKLNRVFAGAGEAQPGAVGLPIERGGPRVNVGSVVEEGAQAEAQVAKKAADGSMPIDTDGTPITPRPSGPKPAPKTPQGGGELKPLRFKSKQEAWDALKRAGGIEDHDAARADMAYMAWKEGRGKKPPPFEGGHFDEINELLNLKGNNRVSGARDAFDRLTNGIKDWGALDEKVLTKIQRIKGFEKARLPDEVQEALLRETPPADGTPIVSRASLQDEGSASFNFGANVEPQAKPLTLEEFDGYSGEVNDQVLKRWPEFASVRGANEAEEKAARDALDRLAALKIDNPSANAKRLEGLYPDGETRAAFDPDGKTGAFDAMPDLDKTRARPPPIPTDAVEKAAVEQQAKTPWDKDAIEAARARLQKIATGKNMINKAAPVAGVVGFATGGPMGIVAGMSAKPAVNAATMAGKALEKSGKAALTPEAMAKSLLGNPNVLTKLAASNGPLSGAAKFVLSGAKEAGEDGLRSRVFVLSMMPEFREWFAQNRDAQGR